MLLLFYENVVKGRRGNAYWADAKKPEGVLFPLDCQNREAGGRDLLSFLFIFFSAPNIITIALVLSIYLIISFTSVNTNLMIEK